MPETNLSQLKRKSRIYIKDTGILIEPNGRATGECQQDTGTRGRWGKKMHLHLLSPQATVKVLESTSHSDFSVSSCTASQAWLSSGPYSASNWSQILQTCSCSISHPSVPFSLQTGLPCASNLMSTNMNARTMNFYLDPNFKFPRKGLWPN